MTQPTTVVVKGPHAALLYEPGSTLDDCWLDEYRVLFYFDGRYLPEADYFTTDFADAKATAKLELLRMEERSPSP